VVSGKASGLASNTLVARHQTLTVPLCAVLRLESFAIRRPTIDRRSTKIRRQGLRDTGASYVSNGLPFHVSIGIQCGQTIRSRIGDSQPRMATCAVSTKPWGIWFRILSKDLVPLQYSASTIDSMSRLDRLRS
jgi:hypothetical protein